MNDELSKALDGAIADAAEMGELTLDDPGIAEVPDYSLRIGIHMPSSMHRNLTEHVLTVYGDTAHEALRRARLIVESVNGREAMARRIAELEAALGTLADEYCTAEYDGGGDMAEVPVELMHAAIEVLDNQALTPKGNTP